MGNVQLEGEALKCYLMKRFNKTEAEAIQIMDEQKGVANGNDNPRATRQGR